MARMRLSVSEVLATIETSSGAGVKATAARLVQLATHLGAHAQPRAESVALRMPGPVEGKPDWLSLFVLSTAGTIYNNWHDRWTTVGVSTSAVKRYEQAMMSIVGPKFVSHPSAFRHAASVSGIGEAWDDLEATIREAVQELRAAMDRRPPLGGARAIHSASTALAALEGQLTETKVSRRGRSSKLRHEALARSGGRCEVCDVHFGHLLGGRGWRVLQVHHREQLSALDEPQWNTIDDLDVVCANCHLLVHADSDAPMSVDALRAEFRAANLLA